jgi:hypothetical protein
MLLLIIVIISVAAFCIYHGYILAGIICLLGFSGKIGFVALLITSIMLFAKGHWVVGALPLLLIGINLLFMDKKKMKYVIDE